MHIDGLVAGLYRTNKHRMRMASFSSNLATRCLMDERKVGDCITASLKLKFGKGWPSRLFAGPFHSAAQTQPKAGRLREC